VILGLEYLRKDDRFDRHTSGTTSHGHFEKYTRPSKLGRYDLKDLEEFFACANVSVASPIEILDHPEDLANLVTSAMMMLNPALP
jgi:hypothetical protein